MVQRDITRLLFAGSDKKNQNIPDLFAKYLKSDEIEQFLINKNYTNDTRIPSGNQNDIHTEANDALMNFIARMRAIEKTSLDQGEANRLYEDVYKNWRAHDYETQKFFTDHIEIRDRTGARIDADSIKTPLSNYEFRFIKNTCKLVSGCPEILGKLPNTNVVIFGSGNTNVKSPINYYSSQFKTYNGMFGEYASHLNVKYDAYVAKKLAKTSTSSGLPSNASVSYPDTSICPSDETKYWKYDVLSGDWYYDMGDNKKLFLSKATDFSPVGRSSNCHNLFINDNVCDNFVKTLLGTANSGSMKEFLNNNKSGDVFNFLPNPLPSSNDYRKMDPRAARKILKGFGFQKVRVTANGYERVQTVEEWIDSRVDKFFSGNPDLIRALKDSQNGHVHNFLAQCICRANTLYKAQPFKQTLAVMYTDKNALVKPFYRESFEMVGGGYGSCDQLKQFLESTRNQYGGAHDSTGGLLSHYMKLNNERYPNMTTSACKYLESRSDNITSLWDNAFNIIDKTSYNKGYLISDRIKNKIKDEIKTHKKLTAELGSIMCGLESLANPENAGVLYEARNKGYVQAGGRADVDYDGFKRLAQQSYDNMLRVNSKLSDNDKRLRGLFLRIIEMMAKDEVEELED